MSRYLERLKTKIRQTPATHPPTKPTEPPFVGFVGDQGSRISGNNSPATDAEALLAAVKVIWPGARLLTEAERAESAEFRGQLVSLREANAKVYPRKGKKR